MSRFIITDLQIGISGGGPLPGLVAGELTLTDPEGLVCYYSLVELEGCLSFYRTDRSILDGVLGIGNDDGLEVELEKGYLIGYEDYVDCYEDIAFLTAEPETTETGLLRKLLAFIVSSPWPETDVMQAAALGKHVDEIVIPICEDEELYEVMADDLICT